MTLLRQTSMSVALAWSVPQATPPLPFSSQRRCKLLTSSCSLGRRSLQAALLASVAVAVPGRRCNGRVLISRGATARQQQVLPFIEPGTGREVVLVACMHFNPQSISKAADVTRELAAQGNLGAVVVESCPSRWQRVQDVQAPGSLLRSIFDNEMQSAGDVAESSGRQVILGDQRVEDLLEQVTQTGKEAMDDFLNPLDGGWQRTGSSLSSGFTRLLNSSKKAKAKQDDSIGIQDFLDPMLLLGAPLAVARYVGSLTLRAPQVALGVGGYLAVFSVLPENIFIDIFSIVQEILILRVLLSAVLRDRDAILARSIKDACEALPRSEGSVVAILGAAHCNGVKRHLIEGTS